MRMKVFLGFVMLLFIGILIALVAVARHARPVMLDERGRPVGAVQTDRR